MRQARDIDVQDVIEKIRQGARRGNASSEIATGQRLPVDTRSAPDLRILESTANIHDVLLASHRPVVGRVAVFVKNLLRQLLTPTLERQVAYNLANTRIVASAHERLAALEERQSLAVQETDRRLGALAEQSRALSQRVHDLEAKIEKLQNAQPTRRGEAERPTEADRRE